MNPREERGLALADAAKISCNAKGWIVPSQTGGTRYTVTLNGPPHSLRSKERRWADKRSTLPRDAQAGYGAGAVRLTSLGLRLCSRSFRKGGGRYG